MSGTRYGDRHGVRYTDQERSTLNFQLGDRKGAWFAEYGDRHDVRYTKQERSTHNVQLSTFNGVTERGHGGRDVGTGTELGRHLSLGFACLYRGVAICSVCIFLSGGVR